MGVLIRNKSWWKVERNWHNDKNNDYSSKLPRTIISKEQHGLVLSS